jgi:transcriptional regulator with XRE-family HTH domain
VTYGARLRELRAERRLSLRDVEERGGPNKDTMSLIERDVHRPHPRTLGRIAEALDMDVSTLRFDLESAERPPLGPAPPSPTQPPLNGFEEGERRSLTAADFNAAETFADVCNRLERFLDIAEREPVGLALLTMQHYLIRVAAGLSLPLMEKEAFRALVLPTAARFIELARRFEELRQSEAVAEEEVVQRRELVKELTRRISEAA